MRVMDHFKTTRTGAAGELTVAAQLILRGLNPFTPCVDDHGVDLMTGSGLKLQVKAAHLSVSKHGLWRDSRHYTFGFHKNFSVYGYRTEKSRRDCPKEFDYAILWGIDENRFWIVPSTQIGSLWSLVMQQRTGPPFVVPEHFMRGMADKTITRKRVAEELGVSVDVIRSYQKGHRGAKGAWSGAKRWDVFEGAWHLLQPIETLRAADAGEPEPGRREILPASAVKEN